MFTARVGCSVPLAVTAKVLKLTDGNFICTGPMAKGNPGSHGPTALVEFAPGIRVIVHPEVPFDVLQAADDSGSTEYILKTVRDSEPGSK
mgnify:CR=1 FL=1